MCGFVGFVGQADLPMLKAMADRIAHRGPDDDGYFSQELGDGRCLHMGFRRLSIIDLADGHQPMESADGRYTISFNGEIYNHKELRLELEGLGYCFRSDHSDTEALLLGYAAWGEGVVPRLNGMFAFAVYDRQQQSLFMARDRFGKKPLFITQDRHGHFAWASEIQALRVYNAAPLELNPKALLKYFAYGFIPAPLTLYQGIEKLEPGSTLRIDLPSGARQKSRYWEYRVRVDAAPEGDLSKWVGEVQGLLEEATQRRLQSDVPLGFFLSGGIDSSAIVALASQALGAENLDTFTIGFNEASFDESGYAREMAEALGTRHFDKVLSMEQAIDLAPAFMGRVDDPIADGSILPTSLLCQFARERVTVALAGDGGDELFAGYDTFDALSPAAFYRKIMPRLGHRLLKCAAGYLPHSQKNMGFDYKVQRFLRGLDHAPSVQLAAWIGPGSLADLEQIFGCKLKEEEVYEEAITLWESSESTSWVDRSLEFFARYYLGEQLMIKADRASMMHSLEVRSPFLDPNLAEYVLRLPHNVKLKGGTRKWILKEAMKPLLPQAVLGRKKKGFGIPYAQWIRAMEPPQGLDIPGIDQTWLLKSYEGFRAGTADHRNLLWAWQALTQSIKGVEGLI